MTPGGVLQKRCDRGMKSTPLHQYLFDFTPVMEQELVLYLVLVSSACNVVGNAHDSRASVESDFQHQRREKDGRQDRTRSDAALI
jgi:cell division protein FtsL